MVFIVKSNLVSIVDVLKGFAAFNILFLIEKRLNPRPLQMQARLS